MKHIIAILLSLLFLGCSSVEKQHFKARSFYEKNRKELANLCNSEFPSETKYIKGDTIVQFKEVKGDTVYEDCPDGTKVKCPENKTIYKTIYQTDTLIKPNTAFEDKLRYKINDLESDNTLLAKEKESLKNDLKQAGKESAKKDWVIFSLGFLCVIGIVVIIKK